jgi:glycerol kinase
LRGAPPSMRGPKPEGAITLVGLRTAIPRMRDYRGVGSPYRGPLLHRRRAFCLVGGAKVHANTALELHETWGMNPVRDMLHGGWMIVHPVLRGLPVADGRGMQERESILDKAYVMGIDEGTTSARTIILDEEGQIVAEAARELTQRYPRTGWVHHDPMEILQIQLGTMHQVLEESKLSPQDIRALGITNQRETTIVWEKASGLPVYNALVWSSRQTVDIVQRWAAEGLNEDILRKTGLPNDAWFTASKLAWILEHVEGARQKAERGELLAGTIDTWLVWNLTGRQRHVTDYSNASRTMVFNIHTLRWDEELCDAFGIPVQMLPEVVPSDAHFGSAGPSFGADIPIQGILGDQQAGLFGQTCFESGLVKNTYGTAGVCTMNSGPEPLMLGGMTAGVAWGLNGEVTYATEGVFFAAGATIQWMRDACKLIYSAADTEWYSSQVADTQGVYFVPAFSGLAAPYWDVHARAAIIGMSSSTNRLHIIRAGLEALAYQTRDIFETMLANSDVELPQVRVDGGVVRNDLLCQFLADILGIPVVRPKSTEATVLGASYMAGLSSGLWTNLAELSAMWQQERIFEPQMSVERRDQLYSGWLAAVELTKGWTKKVNLD